MFESLPLLVRHFLQDGCGWWCSLCPCALGPILPTAPGFQSLWQRGGGVECLHRHKSKNYCAGWEEGKDVRKEVESYHPWQLARRMPIRTISTLCTLAATQPVVLYTLRGWKTSERELLSFFHPYTCAWLVLSSWCMGLSFHNVSTKRHSHHLLKEYIKTSWVDS